MSELWKYGAAWAGAWAVFFGLGMLGAVETVGARKAFVGDAGFVARTALFTGAVTFLVVAFVYRQFATKAAVVVDEEGLTIEDLAYHVVDGKDRGAVVYATGECPPGYQRPADEAACRAAAVPFLEGKTFLDQGDGCVKVKNRVAVFNRGGVPGACLEGAPCVCVDERASCAGGACAVPGPFPTALVVTLAAAAVLLLVAFRRKIGLAVRLAGAALRDG